QSLKYSGCTACNGCKTNSDKCVLKDDLTEVLSKTEKADVLIFASPVYFGDITGQLKCYIDRLYSFFTPDFHTSDKPSRLKSGKKLIFVISQGQQNEKMFEDIYPRYEMFLKWFGFDCSVIRAVGVRDKNDAASDSNLMKQAHTIGENLFSNS
ncbi:MAG: flavodoxin family protein, partial [Armatimonadota bacterium]